MRFNGPSRCFDENGLGQDVKMLKVMLKSHMTTTAPSQHQHHSGPVRSQQRLPDQLLNSLPNTVSVSFRGKIGYELVQQLATKVREPLATRENRGDGDDVQVACSAGSACHSTVAAVAPGEAPAYVMSDVLKAMAVPEEFGLGTLRISFGRHNSLEDVEKAADLIYQVVKSSSS